MIEVVQNNWEADYIFHGDDEITVGGSPNDIDRVTPVKKAERATQTTPKKSETPDAMKWRKAQSPNLFQSPCSESMDNYRTYSRISFDVSRVVSDNNLDMSEDIKLVRAALSLVKCYEWVSVNERWFTVPESDNFVRSMQILRNRFLTLHNQYADKLYNISRGAKYHNRMEMMENSKFLYQRLVFLFILYHIVWPEKRCGGPFRRFNGWVL